MLHREKECVGFTTERKYFVVDGPSSKGAFVKRSLRPAEWQTNPFDGRVVIPRFGNERVLNEAACMRFIAENTSITVPKLYACFEDDGAVYLVRERVDGVIMANLDAEKRKVVEAELDMHLQTMKTLKSSVWGGPTGLVIPPYRIMTKCFLLSLR